MELYYPVTPLSVNQGFGGNPAYYARFRDNYGNPLKGHMGIDLMATHGQPVYAAHDGLAWYVGPDSHGGDGIYIRTTDPDENGKYWTAIYWHLCAMTDPIHKPLVNSLTPIKRGDLIGYADNTGAPFESSGDHLHFGLAECNASGVFLHPNNGFGGCQDPAPFWNKHFANEPVITPQIQQATQIVETIDNLKKVENPANTVLIGKLISDLWTKFLSYFK